jgi:hypothetical protein
MTPSRKWFVAQVTALGALATMWATTGTWDQEETVAAIGLVVAAFSSWAVPNTDPAPRAATLESGRR